MKILVACEESQAITKELRKLVDQGKKEIKEGVVLAISVSDDKIGLAVGVTNKLIEKGVLDSGIWDS